MNEQPTTWTQPDLFNSSTYVEPPRQLVECPTCKGHGMVPSIEALAHQSGAVSRNHPATSVKAARQPSNRMRFGTQRHRALAALWANGPLTAAEVATRIGVSRNQTATRLQELHQAGLVRYATLNGQRVTRPTGPRDEGLVHEITNAGVIAVTDLEAKQ